MFRSSNSYFPSKSGTGTERNQVFFFIGVPKELVQKELKAPASSFMRNGELLMVKFVDKKATGDKEIYVVDSKGTAGLVQVERFEKDITFFFPFHLISDL